MIEKMTKYSFLLLTDETEDFLKDLQELGLMDVKRSQKPVDGTSAAMYSELQSLRKEMETAEKCEFSKDFQHQELTSRLAGVQRARAEKMHWGDIDKDKVNALAAAGCRLHFYSIDRKKFNPAWAETYPIEIIEDDGDTVRFVLADRASEGATNFPLQQMRLADASIEELSSEIDSLKSSIAEREDQMRERAAQVPQMEEEYRVKVQEMQRYLAGHTRKLAADNYITVLTGFAPTADDRTVQASLDEKGIFYLHEPARTEDNPPIKLRNNWFARNFETLTGMYGMPVYDEFDPTPILAPFFLLFWAFCMGDAGYGLVLIAIGFLLNKVNILGLRNHKRLVITLGVGATVIGFFLGTFFGVNLKEVSWIPECLKNCMLVGKLEFAGSAYDLSMIAALAIGVFHICLAMVIKAIGLTKRAGFKEAISTWGWVILIVGGLVVAALALTSVIDSAITKIAVIAIGVLSALGIFIFNKPGRNPLLNIGAGLWDSYQMVTGIFGDVLSYIRLYALGLAGGMLGTAFNSLGAMALSSNPTWQWVPYVVILLIGHALNFAMSCLGAFVHPLRLTFVEYFKNSGYEGRGTQYNPLSNK